MGQNIQLTYFDIYAIILSFGIVIFSLLSISYGIRNIILNKIIRENYPNARHVIPLVLALVWALLFSFVIAKTLINPEFINNTSFGAVFIRPLILLSCAEEAITRKIKYFNSMKLITKMKEVGEKQWIQN